MYRPIVEIHPISEDHVSAPRQSVTYWLDVFLRRMQSQFQLYQRFLQSQGKSDQQFVYEIRQDLAKETLLTGVTASTYCLSLSLLLAFAMLYPEVQLLLFFIIPIRVKYFGVFAAVLWVFSFLGASLPGKLDYLLSMLNVWLFFAPMAYRSLRAWVRREQWKRKNRR